MSDSTAARSTALFDRACHVMPGGNTRTSVWHSPHPPYAASGAGCRLTDVDGNIYLDFLNNYTSMIHGHANPVVAEAVRKQLEIGTCFAMPTESEIELAELLCDRAPGFEQIRFTNSGSEAVMMALKAARAHTGKPKIAKCEGAYHGSYDFAEVSLDSAPESWGNADPNSVAYSAGTPRSVLDEVIIIPFNRPEESEKILAAHADELACVLVDPMPNRAGLMPATTEYLEMLRRFTTANDMLLVFDEVISFRLGHGGAQGEFGVTPDLTSLAKIIGGGFPIGAVAGAAEVMKVFDPRQGKPLAPHGGTFNANPISMVAGKAAMELLTPEEFERINGLGARARDGVAKAFADAGVDGQVTGAGSLLRIHMTNVPLVDYRSARATAAQSAALASVVDYMHANGVLLAETGLCAISTAMGEAEIDEFIDIFTAALTSTGQPRHAAE
ncbi:MAG: aspartate aminotransferase family protein [Rhodospirillaceae bacterium]|nr:aspartate aminotransferase family protein [Rhodospirillaceae bacterium]MDD9916609.1 aspartate aminotransferase family protein [Rhodospirillaceae bacterium]MDD9927686.1 aspartate aminotransferase family protein [Rhodospirillaceae bacterium]